MKEITAKIAILVFRALAWLFWLNSIVWTIAGIIINTRQFETGIIDINTESWFKYLVLGVCIFAIIEALISIFLKHFFLMRPKRHGAYDESTLLGSVRLLVVHFFNYILVNSIAVYGIILAHQAEQISLMFLFGLIWLCLIIYHIPSLDISSKINNKIKGISSLSARTGVISGR